MRPSFQVPIICPLSLPQTPEGPCWSNFWEPSVHKSVSVFWDDRHFPPEPSPVFSELFRISYPSMFLPPSPPRHSGLFWCTTPKVPITHFQSHACFFGYFSSISLSGIALFPFLLARTECPQLHDICNTRLLFTGLESRSPRQSVSWISAGECEGPLLLTFVLASSGFR